MRAPLGNISAPLLQVVGPEDNWILERLARRLAAKLPYAEFVPWSPKPSKTTRLAYYVNYALYNGPSELIDVAFFTHRDDEQGFLQRARQVDFCVCMARLYADWLIAQGVRTVAHIPMGFDAYRYRPRLVLGIVGRLEHPRKGRELVERLRQLPFVEIAVTEGQVSDESLYAFYERLDFVLIPATVEGGPMSLLEGLGMGKPVIAPENVGIVPEFGNSEHIRHYPAGDGDALVRVVTACFEEKLQRSQLVQNRTWDCWAEAHHELFAQLLHERGMVMPKPAPAFRFGMLRELEIPLATDINGLEATVDQAAAHLYYGDYRRARSVLEEAMPHFPCLRPLLKTIPSSDRVSPAPQTAKETTHLKALR